MAEDFLFTAVLGTYNTKFNRYNPFIRKFYTYKLVLASLAYPKSTYNLTCLTVSTLSLEEFDVESAGSGIIFLSAILGAFCEDICGCCSSLLKTGILYEGDSD